MKEQLASNNRSGRKVGFRCWSEGWHVV